MIHGRSRAHRSAITNASPAESEASRMGATFIGAWIPAKAAKARTNPLPDNNQYHSENPCR